MYTRIHWVQTAAIVTIVLRQNEHLQTHPYPHYPNQLKALLLVQISLHHHYPTQLKVLLVVQIILHHHNPTQLKPGQTSIVIDRHCRYVYRTVLHHHCRAA